MKIIFTFLLGVFFVGSCFAQSEIPDNFIQTWYLDYFKTPDEGEVFVNTLDISTGPGFTISENYTIEGNTFCNSFSGSFEYLPYTGPFEELDIFTPVEIVMTLNDCGNEAAYDAQVFNPFLNAEEGEILALTEDYLVIQFPSSGYQVYSNIPVLGVQTQRIKTVKVYPNPTANILIIEDTNRVVNSYAIMDIMGKTVIETQSLDGRDIDVSFLTSGVYFIKVISEAGNATLKFIKE